MNFKIIRVSGISMEPTLSNGSWLICNGLYPRRHSLKRNDIVLAKIPNSRRPIIKRVVGLSGETVEMKEGQLLINNAPPTEPHRRYSPVESHRWVLQNDEFVLLGDNWLKSYDSRHFGCVNIKNINGKLLPLARGLVK